MFIQLHKQHDRELSPETNNPVCSGADSSNCCVFLTPQCKVDNTQIRGRKWTQFTLLLSNQSLAEDCSTCVGYQEVLLFLRSGFAAAQFSCFADHNETESLTVIPAYFNIAREHLAYFIWQQKKCNMQRLNWDQIFLTMSTSQLIFKTVLHTLNYMKVLQQSRVLHCSRFTSYTVPQYIHLCNTVFLHKVAENHSF